MAGVKDFFFSSLKAIPTNSSGEVLGFDIAYTSWHKFECALSEGSWTTPITKEAGGLKNTTTVNYSLGSLREYKLQMLEFLLDSTDFSIIAVAPDNTGHYLSDRGFYTASSDISNDITLQLVSESPVRPRKLAQQVVSRLYNQMETLETICINGETLKINDENITLYG